MLKRILLATALVLGLVGGVQATQAGAVPVNCPGSPYGNGWFDSYSPYTNRHAAVQCSIDGNHVVMNITSNYGGTNYTALGAIDKWIGVSCDNYSFNNGSAWTPFKIIQNDAQGTYGCSNGGYPVTEAHCYDHWYGHHDYTEYDSEIGWNSTQGYHLGGFTYMDPNGYNNGLNFARRQVQNITVNACNRLTYKSWYWFYAVD